MTGRYQPAVARFGAVLAALWAAHDLGDHVAQTDAQAGWKAHDWRAMAGHVASYTALQLGVLALLVPLGLRVTPARLVCAVAWSAGTHALIDRRWPARWVLEHTGSPAFAASDVVPAVLVDPVAQAYTEHRARGWAEWVRDHPGEPQPPPAIGITRNPQLPLHGPYLADQALHHGALLVAALILAGGDSCSSRRRCA